MTSFMDHIINSIFPLQVREVLDSDKLPKLKIKLQPNLTHYSMKTIHVMLGWVDFFVFLCCFVLVVSL